MEVMNVFADYGISEKLQKAIANEMARDKDKWVDFMMRYEPGLEGPRSSAATKSAITIGLSYIAGGIIPLSPYFFIHTASIALQH